MSITPAFPKFFKELADNNNKNWFDENRKRYEQDIRNPFISLVGNLLPEVKKLDSEFDEDPKKCLFRINRDIRFSKDKSPYNTSMKAAFVNGGRKSGNPGYYLAISADSVHVGGGLYDTTKDGLEAIRECLTENAAALEDIIKTESFCRNFAELKGDALKRPPTGLKELADRYPFVKQKQFYFMSQSPIAPLLKAGNLEDFITEKFKAGAQLNNFLKQALNHRA